MFDTAVIGGGVVGCLIARELSRTRLKVAVLEGAADVAMKGASAANSGIAHAGFDPEPGTLMAALNVEGSARMPALCAELHVPFVRNGSLVLGRAGEEGALQALCERGKINGAEVSLIGRAGLEELRPGISPAFTAALWAPKGGIVCPYQLTIAAMGNAMDNGAELFTDFRVVRVVREGKGFALEAEDGRTVRCRTAVNAAGIHADEISALFGAEKIGLTPRKGEYLLLEKGICRPGDPTLFTLPDERGKGVLVSPTADGNLILGPTAQDSADKEDTATTAEGLRKVREKALEMVPDLPLNRVITSFCGVRAVPEGGDFVLGLSKTVPGLVQAAGIQSPGLTSSPAIAAFVRARLGELGLDVAERPDFRPERPSVHDFGSLPEERKNEIIRRDPAFGRMVCRCEHISEGEILAVLRQNPRPTTLDGIKRRTRAGMGRCQGGFCSPLAAELLSRHLGVPLEEITLKGKGSELLAGTTGKGAKAPKGGAR